MSELTYQHEVTYRVNVHAKKGHEWALNLRLRGDSGRTYTLTTFDTEPPMHRVDELLALFERSVVIYQESLIGFFSFPKVSKEEK